MIGVILAVLLVGAGLIQDFIPGVLVLGQVKAPILLSLVLYYALAHSRTTLLWAAILGGILQDSLSLVPIGYSALTFCLVGLWLRRFREVLFTQSLATAILVGGVGHLLVLGLIQILLRLGEDWGGGSWGSALMRLLGALIMGMVTTPVVWWLARAMDERVGNLSPTHAEI
jgi:rod shape-determining protein MreD